MKTFLFVLSFLVGTLSAIGLFSFTSCGGGVGTCTCTCVIEGAGTRVDELTGNYTEDECRDAADINATGESANACGEFSNGSVTCTSSWDG